ncbi:hypothetical protein OH77DRAFT_491529 [Trametes cingulata]|nr:hypothetical protein OH77DRAFT_491529 [Trametes cingulata]
MERESWQTHSTSAQLRLDMPYCFCDNCTDYGKDPGGSMQPRTACNLHAKEQAAAHRIKEIRQYAELERETILQTILGPEYVVDNPLLRGCSPMALEGPETAPAAPHIQPPVVNDDHEYIRDIECRLNQRIASYKFSASLCFSFPPMTPSSRYPGPPTGLWNEGRGFHDSRPLTEH